MKKLSLILAPFIFVTGFGHSQYIINTFAGNGTPGFGGDGGPAGSSILNGPGGVDLDALGNVYIADKYNERVRKVVGGTINTMAGTGTQSFSGDGGLATAATMYYPTGVAVGKTIANVYITDYSNQRVRLVTPAGIISTFAGNGVQGFFGDGGLATACEFYNPYEVAVDNNGNVYICDRYNHRIRKVDGSGTITTIAGTGTPSFSGDGGLATAAELYYPSAVYVDAFNNIYIADQGNHRVRKITAGIITTIGGNGTPGFSGDGGLATSAQFYNPHGIFVDNGANIYIADSDNNRVRKISPGGIITTIAGDGTGTYGGDGGLATLAQLKYPTKVAVNNAGAVYVADFNNHAVRILTPMAGLEENAVVPNISIYPNPSTGIIQIVVPMNTAMDGMQFVSITNMLGEVVYNKEMFLIAGAPSTIDITDSPAGVYFIRIGNSIEQFVKQ